MLVQLEVNASESFPTPVEIETIGLVDVLFAEIAGTEPHAPFAETVGRFDFQLCLGKGCDGLVGEVVGFSHAITEGGGDFVVLVAWVTNGEHQVDAEPLDGCDDGIGEPSERGDVVEVVLGE